MKSEYGRRPFLRFHEPVRDLIHAHDVYNV